MTSYELMGRGRGRYGAVASVVVMALMSGVMGWGAVETARQTFDRAAEQYGWANYEAALGVLESFGERYPTSVLAGEAQLMIGRCTARLGRQDEAVFALYRAAYMYPHAAHADDALMALAGVLHAQGDNGGVREVCARLVERHPASPHAAYAQTCIGAIYGAVGKPGKAREAVARVVRDYAGSPYVTIAQAGLKELGPAPPPVAVKPPPSTAVKPPAIAVPPSVDGATRVGADDPIVIRTARRGPIELLLGTQPDPARARLHLRGASGGVALRFEGQWLRVGAQDAYGKQVRLESAITDGNDLVWTFRHELASGTRLNVFRRTETGWQRVGMFVCTP